jgi:hypothetical protein
VGVKANCVFAEGIRFKHPFLLSIPDWLAMTSLTHIISQQTHHLRSASVIQSTSAANADVDIDRHGHVLWCHMSPSFGDDY